MAKETKNHFQNLKFLDDVWGYGHINVLGTHPTTIEITTEDFLTKNGNCIIGIKGNKGVKGFSPKLKSAILSGKKINVFLEAGNFKDDFYGYGHKDLLLSNPISMVMRTSNFISDRTALINCSIASNGINRDLINYLQKPEHKIRISFYCEK
ncbi:MAG: DUF371 domain-containing protein [Promethearchaeota archaeon]